MKILMYISGIVGSMFLVFTFIGAAANYPKNYMLLITGGALLVFLYLPLLIYMRLQHRKKIKQIIENYNNKKPADIPVDSKESKMKGWNMNTSPFRKRKSGLTWGGGNVHAANADRGTRRTFMKR